MTGNWTRCPHVRKIPSTSCPIKSENSAKRSFLIGAGKTLEDIVEARLTNQVKAPEQGKAFKLNQTDHAQGHILPDVPAFLGFDWEFQDYGRRSAPPGKPIHKSAIFYQSVLITLLDAASEFILRYAKLADDQFATETDRARQNELAFNLQHLPMAGGKSSTRFREALQSVWFLFVLLQIESNASSFSFWDASINICFLISNTIWNPAP